MIIELILIQLIIVYIIDLSGVVDSIKLFISKHLTKNKIVTTNFSIKPFDCSLCSTWWIGLIYLLICHSFTIPYIALVALLSFLTPISNNILLLMKDLIGFEINKIYEWLQRQTNMD